MEAQALDHERRVAKAAGEEALKHAIAAAELYMQAADKAKKPEDRKRLRRKCAELIALGERLKVGAKGSDAASRRPVPVSTRPLTTAEKTIVLKASRLHGHVFPPWESAPAPESFSDAGGQTYTDPSHFSLSPEQQEIFDSWRRPAGLPGARDGSLDGDLGQLMIAEAEPDLAQDLATDCSVVASLCAATCHFGPKDGSLLASLMYPFDHKTMRPQVSKSGKYVFRMYFNGTWRHVTIDDRLPVSKTDRTLYVVDRRNPRLIWPALIEKAYLKIRGGYDFPGSNSGTDLHALTGWIPEQIFLQSDEIELDETWTRIKEAYDERNAIVTLGTGNILPEEEKALGLVKEHDYAVMDMKTEDGSRLLLIKNPWIDSLVWTGMGSSATLKAHTAGSTADGASNQFWMAFEDVLQHFDSLYVNWNPALFAYRQDHHCKWETPHKTEELVFTQNPQYSVLSPTGSPVWVLLSRHWQDGELEILRQRKAERDRGDASLATVSKQLGFMAIALYAASPAGTRVPLPDPNRRLHQGPFVDSPNTLLRYDPSPGTAQTLVVTQTELPLPAYTFTLSFFSQDPLTIIPAAPPLPHNTSLKGTWTRRTAGGSAAHPSYFSNPQYSLTLSRPSPLSLVLSTSARDLPIHIAVLFSPSATSRRVTSLSGRDILLASTEYHHGCTSASTPLLDAGTYTVVLSTFEPGQLGDYTLRLSAATPLEIKPVPADAAGMLRTRLPFTPVSQPHETAQQSSPSLAGERIPERTHLRLRAPIHLHRLTRLSAHAITSPTPSPSHTPHPGISISVPTTLRISLEQGHGPHRTILSVSRDGDFADAAMGLRTAEVDVEPEVARARGGLWVVLEGIGGGGGGGVSPGSRAGTGGGGGGGFGSGSGSGTGTRFGGRGGETGVGAGWGGVHVEVLSDGVVQVGGWEVAEEE